MAVSRLRRISLFHPRASRTLRFEPLEHRLTLSVAPGLSDSAIATLGIASPAGPLVAATTTTTLSSAANPAAFGQSVTFTAKVTATAGTPTGTVTFKDGTTTLGTGTLAVVGGIDRATFTTSSLSVANHSIKAVYAGTSKFKTSTSSVLSETVNKSATVTSVTSSVDPAAAGQVVTFTATVGASLPGSGTPTGTVTFKDNGVTLGTGKLTGGKATFSSSTLAIGSHPIKAVYAGNVSYKSSTSAAFTETIQQQTATTTTMVSSDANPSVFGQFVNLTATVTASSGMPSGNVAFYDGSTYLGTSFVSAGSTTFGTNGLSVGVHSIQAIYAGTTGFGSSSSSLFSQTVNKASDTASLTSSANPTPVGQPVTFTATVSPVTPGSGIATGIVTFNDGGTILGTGTLTGGQTTFTTSTLALGNHTITAVYAGDGSFQTSTSSGLALVVQGGTATTTTLARINPSAFGGVVHLEATISAATSGDVTFFDGSTSLGTSSLTSNHVASLDVTTLAAGTHSITAMYNGNATYAPSTSAPQSELITAAGHHILFVTASAYFITPDHSVPPNLPFFGGIAAADWVVTNEAAQAGLLANWNPNIDTAIYHSITSISNSDAVDRLLINGPIFNVHGDLVATSANDLWDGTLLTPILYDSTGALATASESAITGSSASGRWTGASAGNLDNPSGSATVGDPTSGTGFWMINGNDLASGALYLYGISPLLPGATISNSTTTLGVSNSSPALGESVTLTATVASTSPDTAPPTGKVQFYDGSTLLGTTTIVGNAGAATFATSSLSAGSHSITAVYSGDLDFHGSTSSATAVNVQQGATSTTLTATPTSGVYGQQFSFSASVSASANPSGTVSFYDGANLLGSGSVSGGTAAISGISLNVGSHTITAVYHGDASFAGSTSPATTVTVTKAPTTTALATSTTSTPAGQNVTFTATVTMTGGTPIGNLTFKDGTTNLGTVSLSGSVASLTVSTLAVGSHSITAKYNGTSNIQASTSSATTVTITQAVHYILFVTQFASFITPDQSVPANPPFFGGIAAADWTVTMAASEAGLITGWNQVDIIYHSITSISGSNAADRLVINGPVYNTHGDLIANNAADLWDGSLQNPVGYDATGAAASSSEEVITGSQQNGLWSADSAGNLDNPSAATSFGYATSSDHSWLFQNVASASGGFYLYGLSPALPGATPSLVPMTIPADSHSTTVAPAVLTADSSSAAIAVAQTFSAPPLLPIVAQASAAPVAPPASVQPAVSLSPLTASHSVAAAKLPFAQLSSSGGQRTIHAIDLVHGRSAEWLA